MAALPSGFLILDANVLIDYCATDRSILTLISRHVGQIHVPVELLEEVKALDESECDRLGLHVFEPELEQLAAAGKRRPGLSYYDHLCLLVAKQGGWTCVTNDGKLRRDRGWNRRVHYGESVLHNNILCALGEQLRRLDLRDYQRYRQPASCCADIGVRESGCDLCGIKHHADCDRRIRYNLQVVYG